MIECCLHAKCDLVGYTVCCRLTSSVLTVWPLGFYLHVLQSLEGAHVFGTHDGLTSLPLSPQLLAMLNVPDWVAGNKIIQINSLGHSCHGH